MANSNHMYCVRCMAQREYNQCVCLVSFAVSHCIDIMYIFWLSWCVRFIHFEISCSIIHLILIGSQNNIEPLGFCVLFPNHHTKMGIIRLTATYRTYYFHISIIDDFAEKWIPAHKNERSKIIELSFSKRNSIRFRFNWIVPLTIGFMAFSHQNR